MKPKKLSAAPQERYIDFLCHPVGIVFSVDVISIIMTSLRDLVAPSVSPPRWGRSFFGCGFCFVYPPRPSDTPQEGNFGCGCGFVGRGFCFVYTPRPSDTPQEGNF